MQGSTGAAEGAVRGLGAGEGAAAAGHKQVRTVASKPGQDAVLVGVGCVTLRRELRRSCLTVLHAEP